MEFYVHKKKELAPADHSQAQGGDGIVAAGRLAEL
jgi:hypothetical protein